VAERPDGLKYTLEHEWVDLSSGSARVGITDFAQAALGDIVYVQLPEVGTRVAAGAVCGEVESTKSVSEIYAPLTGEITAINADLTAAPDQINASPYEQGWLFEISVSDESELDGLLSSADYGTATGE
jgi:glycine cleavage system H protein